MQGPPNLPSIRARLVPYSFHILSGLALTSMGFHVLNQRQRTETERLQMAARQTILEDLTAKLRSGDVVPEVEVDRMMKLADVHQRGQESNVTSTQHGTPGWKEVLLGRKKSESQEEVEVARAVKEWEQGICVWLVCEQV